MGTICQNVMGLSNRDHHPLVCRVHSAVVPSRMNQNTNHGERVNMPEDSVSASRRYKDEDRRKGNNEEYPHQREPGGIGIPPENCIRLNVWRWRNERFKAMSVLW